MHEYHTNFTWDVLYQKLLQDILDFGVVAEDRTGVGTVRIFGKSLDYDLRFGFPLLQLKETSWKNICHEFQWMIVNGSTDVTWLEERGIKFWSPWKGEDGSIGLGYGYQFRKYEDPRTGERIDQVQNLIRGIKEDPYSRRHIINLWNIADIEYMRLPPCHMFTQWFVDDGHLNCLLYQRSVDSMLGLPYNIAFYSLFTHVVANICNLTPGKFLWRGGDVHIYRNHVEAAEEVISRKATSSPSVVIQKRDDIDDYQLDDYGIVDYNPLPPIKLPVAV